MDFSSSQDDWDGAVWMKFFEKYHTLRLGTDDDRHSYKGTFYDALGNAYPPNVTPISSRAARASKQNQYGRLLTSDGTPGNRLIWLTYTDGARQAA